MGNDVLRYKGYYAKPAYDPEDQIIYGKILGISDLVDFYSESAKEVENEFHKAVDEYLDFCKEIGKEPQKAYSGSFNVRISEELHRDATICAQTNGMTLNSFVEHAIEDAVEKNGIVDEVLKTKSKLVITGYVYDMPQNETQKHPFDCNVVDQVNQQWNPILWNAGKVSGRRA